MPKRRSPIVGKESSPHPPRQIPIVSTTPNHSSTAPPRQPIQLNYLPHTDYPILPQPTYSQTILQPPTLATDPSALPQQNINAGPPSPSRLRRQSSSSMRNASMTFENIPQTSTPTGRISKAKKGKRVHACEFPGCGKVFTRAEHRRRHEQNHNPEAMYRCSHPGCGKSFHRMDLLQRHQERHEIDASSLPHTSTSRHSNVFTSPPSILQSRTITSPPPASESTARTSSGAPLSIGSLVHPPPSHSTQYGATDPSLTGLNYPFPTYDETYFYGSEGSRSPASDNYGQFHHRQSISSASSVAAFEPQVSPMMRTSMPAGSWMPATAPPLVLPSTMYEEGSNQYMPSSTVTSLPVPLHELDGHEYAAIQRELSSIPGLIFESNGNTIRWDCLDHYWQYFHPSFPIVHKPTFLPAKPSPLLASAVLAIGSFYDTRPDAKLYSLALQESATRLLRRRTNISSRSRIADLQTVLLLEILGKYCARQISAQTSSRFRALFASLHQSRQWLSTSPLAVYKTQREPRSTEDLKRAHKFWVEHETRRRIFHACSVLDAQQVSLFEQRPTIVQHHNNPQINDAKSTVNLPCNEELWEASTLEDWAAKAADCIYQDLNEARANYAQASVSDYSFFQHQIINAYPSAALRCSEEMSSPPRSAGITPMSKTRFNYHVFQMAKHVPVRSLLIVAAESWLLGRKIVQEAEYTQAKRIVRDWVKQTGPNSRPEPETNILQAHWHALKLLRMVVDPVDGSNIPRTTNMLHEDWSIYMAALVCWVHGYGRRSCSSTADATASRTLSPANERKRKNSDVDTQPRKRSMASAAIDSRAMPAPASTPLTTQSPYAPAVTSYPASTFAAFAGPIDAYSGAWIDPFYNTPTTAYLNHTEPIAAVSGFSTATESSLSATDTSTYNSSVTTATSTPPILHSSLPAQRKASVAASVASNHDVAVMEAVSELKQYLLLTDVSSHQDLALLEPSVLGRTKGLLDSIRLIKFGEKGVVGGLMNDAERVLQRLAEGRNAEMF